jgi:DedD protein
VDREPTDAPSGSTGPSDARAATSSTSGGSAPRSASAASTGSAAAAREPSQVATAPSTPARGTAADAPAREAAPAARTEANATGDWAVQVGSFGDEDNARRLADRVTAFGHAPKISTYRAGGRVMYRVRVGPQATRAAAEAAASALAAHGFPAQVVTN